VLGLGVDADAARLGERDDLAQCRNLEPAVVRRAAQFGQALTGAQGLELSEREVFGEPAGDGDAVDGLGYLAIRELRPSGDIGGA